MRNRLRLQNFSNIMIALQRALGNEVRNGIPKKMIGNYR